ncbi:DEKNAAC105103 [Brettanomyces naardenensis]|uniref:DEKNAAC105103 n=1 Tax=Brettanomyces naardenensis TaxID=13370 RepID=A0A448YST3_BRENA|nr:DEKNAAC105103 [Brettanomyces naardenensis]
MNHDNRFESAIDLEEQPEYRDVPEFDEVNDEISNRLLEIGNTLSNLQRNLDVMEQKVGRGNVDKYQANSIALVNSLLEKFRDLSVYSKRLNGIDSDLLNKSQVFVKGKLNQSLKGLLGDFQESQTRLSEIDKELNRRNMEVIRQEEEATQAEDGYHVSPATRQKVVVEYEPVNAEEIEYQRNLVEERERDIERISTGVNELNEIFQDLSSMVVSQGEIIDNIETNIYSTLHDTRMASKHLTRADRYDRNKRKFCFWLWVIVCVILFFMVLIIFA